MGAQRLKSATITSTATGKSLTSKKFKSAQGRRKPGSMAPTTVSEAQSQVFIPEDSTSLENRVESGFDAEAQISSSR